LYEAIHRLDRSVQQVRPPKGCRHDQRRSRHPLSDDADATRATLAKVLGTRTVDAGGGWLIFALPPAELAVHPATRADGSSSTSLLPA